ncbi:MAG: hypothetical protein OXI60_09090 [Acidiferrobacterales bacterium]|nr:hypothetical protein [Acidiferrobacterales bacterium]
MSDLQRSNELHLQFAMSRPTLENTFASDLGNAQVACAGMPVDLSYLNNWLGSIGTLYTLLDIVELMLALLPPTSKRGRHLPSL